MKTNLPFPAIDQQIGYLCFNRVTWPGIMQALKTATLQIYPGRSAVDGVAQSHPLMHRLRFLSPRKDNKHILLITRRKRSNPNWKRNGILKIRYTVLDRTIGQRLCLRPQMPVPPASPLQSRKSWSWRAGNTKQGYKLTEGLSWHLVLQIYRCNECSV